jgi:hypothetical protein
LIVGMGASQLVVTGETIYNHAGGPDKSLIYIEGATHGSTPVDPKYGNTTTTTVKTFDTWMGERF